MDRASGDGRRGGRGERSRLNRDWLTRFVILRLLGFVYCAAFLSLALQVVPLLGHDGLLPASDFLARGLDHAGSRAQAMREVPTIFWFGSSDRVLVTASWVGLALSVPVLLGFANAILLATLWALYL